MVGLDAYGDVRFSIEDCAAPRMDACSLLQRIVDVVRRAAVTFDERHAPCDSCRALNRPASRHLAVSVRARTTQVGLHGVHRCISIGMIHETAKHVAVVVNATRVGVDCRREDVSWHLVVVSRRIVNVLPHRRDGVRWDIHTRGVACPAEERSLSTRTRPFSEDQVVRRGRWRDSWMP